jgi:Tol biopolymer transport system component/DNA-binding winged helix-turn-helix (wHTH) protein
VLQTPDRNGVVRFGNYEMHLTTQELFKCGLRIKLTPQAFRVLHVLVEGHGQLVTREELHRTLWPQETFVDFDHGLNNAIKKIRDALCDSADAPRYIETLPRLGYRFIGQVNSVPDVDAADPVFSGNGRNEVLPQSAQTPDARHLAFRSYRMALLLLAVCAVGVWYFTTHRLSAKLPLEFVPLTSLPRDERAPTFSPDGEQIAFDYENESGWDIFTKRLDGETIQRLTDPPGVSSCPSWSPDGKYIAYLRGYEESALRVRSGIYLMNPLGGAKRRLLNVENVSCKVSWSPDSKTLVYGPAWSENEPAGLFLVDIDNPVPRRLLSSPPHTLDDGPAFSRDGKKIAFARNTSLGTKDLYVVSVSGGEAQRITYLNANLGGPVWTTDDKNIIFWGSTGGSGWNLDLYSVPATGGTPERLPFAAHNESSPTISRDGSKLAYVQSQFDPNIWRVALSAQRDSPKQFIASTWFEDAPDFSPDGTRISFLSERDGSLAIWICNADGSNPVRLMGPDGPNIPRWSPSGDRIAFDSRSAGRHQIYVVDARGGKPLQLTFGDFNSQTPSWSADGKWVYFGSDRSGGFEVWKTSLDSKQTVQVTKQGGFYAQESPDGKFVFYNKPQDKMANWTYVKHGVYKIPTDGGEEKLVVPEATWLWRVGREGIYYTSDGSPPRPSLKIYRFSTGKTETLADLNKQAWGGPGGIAISPDGKTFFYAQVDTEGKDLMLVKNGSW